ncbi:MAG: hypothetical protein FJY88_05380 [Candidatus Eisenbacteria bacterium]|nr:hypothetical protein [Candidatus Eisenbacteria bacterium]
MSVAQGSSAGRLFPKKTQGLRSASILAVLALIIEGLFAHRPLSAARAGVIEPVLQAELSALAPSDHINALFFLHEQADIPALDAELKRSRATRRERHRSVVQALQATARASQGPLLMELDRLAARGEAIDYAAYWVTNLVVVRAPRATIEDLAGRTDIAAVAPGLRPVQDRITPHPPGAAEGELEPLAIGSDSRGIGVSQGLRAINADRVWRELGINGAGALIGILDTGVDGHHPALSGRWRGNAGHPWQECWHDVVGVPSEYPNDDGSGHGTHVLGTAAGLGAATGDTIGVAWAAQWIAANAISQPIGSDFDFDVFECLQWFADPDGDVNTVDDVPDVLVNAWGVSEAFGRYTDCDSRWWPAIDNCEAAGIVLVWTAGGDGPGTGTIRSPADRATSVYNAFSVGSVDAAHSEFPYPITFFSSRGPSGCPVADPLRIKPEVAAPGVEIYSSYPGGTYQIWSGNAMATAHVGGVVALLRSADPDLEVDSIKQILMETARDGGEPGEDNAYGWGTIDAYAAVRRCASALEQEGGPPDRCRILAALPNPFTSGTTLRYRMEIPGPGELAIHDPGGRMVRAIPIGPISEGDHTAVWDGRDQSGRPVPTGVYFSRLRLPGCRGQMRLLLAR